ncbi:MAG: class I SAM-dependent methyltransferase [Vicinamibacterales bacterium]
MVFNAALPSDFDWMEQQIISNKYYEAPGVWVFDADADKRLLAEMAACFAPARSLDLGCASGAVIECLEDLGITAEGVEISEMAIARAADRVRPRLHHGDLLSLDLAPGFDLVMGFDVFEHLNPNKLPAYLSRLAALMVEGAFLFCNIPAFGIDPVFGVIFPHYLDAWQRNSAEGRPFAQLHCDDLGYPIHGHLVWADSAWWAEQCASVGLTRETDVERAFHGKYDAHMKRHAPARLSYFVFSKQATAERRTELIQRIENG